jgi:thiol-disulfide isomerase/thioredoxin
MKRFVPSLVAGLTLLPALAQAAETNNVVIAPHARDLMVLRGDQLVPFKSEQFLKAPYTVLYFGAGWCPDCRRFSPNLVAAYDHESAGQRRFEVLLLTMDKSQEGLLKFMRSEKMKWPALAFDRVAGAADLKKYYSGHGIPCLTVIDHDGKIVLQSKSDQDATEVLKQLEDLLKNHSKSSP